MDINKKQTLSVFPYIQNIGYSDPINSEKLNKQFQSLKESVLRALIRSQEINTSLTTMEMAVNAQAMAIGKYYNVLSNSNTPEIYITAFENLLENNTNISYDTAYGYTTLKLVANYSKIPRNEGYDGKVSPNVTILINGEVQPYNNDVYRCLDNSSSTLFLKQYPPNTLIEMEIQLPPSLTKRFNYIKLDPFPIFGFDILNIQYQDYFGNFNDLLKNTFGTHNPLLNNHGFPTKIYVSPKEFNGTVKIFCKTNDTGYFGFSNIDIGFMDFNNSTQTCFLKFNNFNDTSVVRRFNVNSAVLDYYFDSPNAKSMLSGQTSVLEAKLFVGTVNELTGAISPSNQSVRLAIDTTAKIIINYSFILNIGELLFLELKFTENNMTTPVFRGVKLNYT